MGKNPVKWKDTPEWRAYYNARARCLTPHDKKTKELYADRGIKFLFRSFQEFIECIGLRPSPKHIIDRIENDGHYEPGNIRWATLHDAMLNRRMTPRRRRAICKNLVEARKHAKRNPRTGRFCVIVSSREVKP